MDIAIKMASSIYAFLGALLLVVGAITKPTIYWTFGAALLGGVLLTIALFRFGILKLKK